MENDILLDSERVNGVMERVFGETADFTSMVASLIESEISGIRLYTAIAARLGGEPKRTIYAIIRAKRTHLKLLRALYFIKTGKTAEFAPACAVISGAAEGIRLQYSAELKLSREYTAAAGFADCDEVRREFIAMSRISQQNAYRLLILFKRTLR